MEKALSNLLLAALKIKKDEHAVFIHDSAFRSIAVAISEFGHREGLQISTLEIEYDGISPMSARVQELLRAPQPQVILFGLIHNIWHTAERKEAKYKLKKRLASLVCSPEDFSKGALVFDINKIARIARRLAPLFKKGGLFRVTTPGGSAFDAVIGVPFCEDGLYYEPATGGDFPSGEVGFGPAEGSVNGRIVYDVKVQHVGVLDSPLALDIKNDQITHIEGKGREAFLEVCQKQGEILKYISEISLGMNPGGILTPSSQFIPEEKNYGTLHCGHGGNASYGSRVGPHLDGVMDRPTIFLNDVLLMKDGKLLTTHIEDDLLVWLHDSECQ
jgi:leucyl aminopeptidase (aminopeptidase T)